MSMKIADNAEAINTAENEVLFLTAYKPNVRPTAAAISENSEKTSGVSNVLIPLCKMSIPVACRAPKMLTVTIGMQKPTNAIRHKNAVIIASIFVCALGLNEFFFCFFEVDSARSTECGLGVSSVEG